MSYNIEVSTSKKNQEKTIFFENYIFKFNEEDFIMKENFENNAIDNFEIYQKNNGI